MKARVSVETAAKLLLIVLSLVAVVMALEIFSIIGPNLSPFPEHIIIWFFNCVTIATLGAALILIYAVFN